MRGVHTKNGRYYWVHKNKWHPLTRVDDGKPAMLAAYERLQGNAPPSTAWEVFSTFLKTGLRGKALSTQREYRRHLEGPLKVAFGHMTFGKVRPKHIAVYLDRKANVAANREKATLSTVYAWAMRKGYAESNPCLGVRRNPESPRTRYIEDAELEQALDLAPVELRDAIALGYLTGMRQGDLLKLEKDNLGDDGIRWVEGKRKVKRHILWSDLLRAAVDAALARSKCDRVLTGQRGQGLTSSGFQTAWQRFMRTWPGERFTFHDIRAKAASDAPHGRELLAHGSESLFRRVYKRRAAGVAPTK